MSGSPTLDYFGADDKTTAMKSATKRVELNWGKLLGFNQVHSRQNKQAKAVLAAKIGAKPGAGGSSGSGSVGGIVITH